MSPELETLLGRLEGLRATGRDRWISRCPAHQDKDPSLSVAVRDDGRILVHCHAGCAPGDVVAAVGLELKDLFEQPLYHRAQGAWDRPMRHAGDLAKENLRRLKAVDVFRRTGQVIDREALQDYVASAVQLAAGRLAEGGTVDRDVLVVLQRWRALGVR